MSPLLTDAIIRFVRIVIAAALVALGAAVLNVDLTLGLHGVGQFFLEAVATAVIHAATEFARTYFGTQLPVTPSGKPKAGALRVRVKTKWDWLPI
jgi:hypothetical protein